MIKSYKHYIEHPKDLSHIDFADLLLHIEQRPADTNLRYIQVLKRYIDYAELRKEDITGLITHGGNRKEVDLFLRNLVKTTTSPEEIVSEDSLTEEDLVQEEIEVQVVDEQAVIHSEVEQINDTDASESIEATPYRVVRLPLKVVRTNTPKNEPIPEKELEIIKEETDEKPNIPEEQIKTVEEAKPVEKISYDDGQPRPFLDWLRTVEGERFVEEEVEVKPKSKKKKKKKKKRDSLVAALAQKSIEDNKALASETLAEILVAQGHFKKAIDMYKRLKKKNPKKSRYFADRIEELKKSL